MNCVISFEDCIPANKGVLLGVAVRPIALLAVIALKGELAGTCDACRRAGVPETEGVLARKRGGGAFGIDSSTVWGSFSISISDVGKSKAGGEDMADGPVGESTKTSINWDGASRLLFGSCPQPCIPLPTSTTSIRYISIIH